MWQYHYTDELYHHGVKGQRWGIRRYQNKDGTLTPRGRKRAEKLRNEYLAITGKKQLRGNNHKTSSNTNTTSTKPKTKSVSEMSNDELSEVITRKKLEEKYYQLNPKKVSAGKKFVDEVLMPAATQAGKDAIQSYLTKQFKKALGLQNDSNKNKDKNKKER